MIEGCSCIALTLFSLLNSFFGNKLLNWVNDGQFNITVLKNFMLDFRIAKKHDEGTILINLANSFMGVWQFVKRWFDSPDLTSIFADCTIA
jgi:hypothetical protein